MEHRASARRASPTRRAGTTAVACALLLGSAAAAPWAHGTVVPASVSKVAPVAVAAGQGVTLSGDGLTSVTAVTFLGEDGPADDVAATSLLVTSPKTVIAQVPAGAVTGKVAVTTREGATTPGPAVTVLAPPTPSVPAGTVVRGRDRLTVRGTNLGVKRKVAIAGKAAAVLAAPAPTSTDLTLEVPTGLKGGPTDVTVTAEGGTGSAAVYIAPDVKAVVPAVGTTAGGTVALVSGTGLTGAERVTFGGVASPVVHPLSDKEIAVRVPAGVTGAAPVVVTTRSGTLTGHGTSVVPFTYQPIPAVAALSRNWAPVNAGPTAVTATGANLVAGSVVTLGATVLAKTVDETAGTMSFLAPKVLKAGTAPLTIVNGPFKTVVPFTYAAGPTVTSVAPAAAPAGTPVVVTGTHFVTGTTATFGSAAAACTVLDTTKLRCVAPAGTGAVDVTVTTEVGVSAQVAASRFTYNGTAPPAAPAPVAPSFKGLAPAAAPARASISILGGELQRVTGVTFPSASGPRLRAQDVLAVDSKRLVVRVPAGAASGQIELLRAGGAPVRSGSIRFTAVAPLRVTTITAVGDRTVGVLPGDTVVLRGGGLLAGAIRPTVTVGGVVAPVLGSPVPSESAVAVKVPTGSGSAPVLVSTPFGSVSAPAPLYFLPTVKAAKPVLLPDGRTAMSLTGSGFTGADRVSEGAGRRSAVTFGGIPAEEVVAVNDKSLLAVPPTAAALYDPLKVTTQDGGWSGDSGGTTTPLRVAAPAVDAVTPDFLALGSRPGPVTITGAHLKADSVVKFGDALATVLTAAGDGTTLVVVPPNVPTARKVPVSVSNRIFGLDYVGSLANGFGYLPEPQVTDLSPVSAPVGSPAADVTLTGRNLLANTVVTFGGQQATVRSAAADGTSLLVAPPASVDPRIVDVQVKNFFDGVALAQGLPGAYAYTLAPAAVTALSLSTAVPGTQMTINGAGFSGVTSVRFGSTPVARFDVVNGTTIVAVVPTTPSGEHGTSVPVRVVNGTGSPSTGDHAWTWDARPAITAASPASAVAGEQPAQVTLSGSNLLATTAVKFGATAATVVSAAPDGTSLVVVPPTKALAGPVSINVVNSVNGQPYSETLSGGFDYLPIPSVSAVTPPAGPVAAMPDDVTITGRNLFGNTAVRFGTEPATVRSAQPDGTKIVVTPPTSYAAGPVDVTVVNSYNTEPLSASVTGGYGYVLNAAVVKDVSLTTAPPGTQVTVSGSSFVGVTAVRFGPTPVPFQVVNPSNILVTVPGTPSTRHGVTVPVTVVNGTGGPSTGDHSWTWDARPSVAGVAPTAAVVGLQPGHVTVNGTNLMPTSTVTFGGAAAQVVSAAPDGTSMVVVPPLRTSAASLAVSVSNTVDGITYTATLHDGFRYKPVPSIASLSPSAGPVNTTPDNVTITGRNLASNTVVRFGSASAQLVSAAADGTSMVVTPPTAAVGGPVNVSVTNLYDGEALTDTLVNGYGYALSPATITGLSLPTASPGTQVTVTGTSFAGVSSVKFGTTSVPFEVSNSTTIFVTVPATPIGQYGSTVAVSVVNGTGSPSTGSYSWTWDAKPLIASLSPGSATVGDAPSQATLSGFNLLSSTVVKFGSTIATQVSVTADGTQMVVNAPTGTVAGPVTVSAVNTINGTNYTGSLASGFRYLPVPSVSAGGISPATGSTGTTPANVTLTGRNLLSTSVVRFDGQPATVRSAATDGTSMVVTPPLRHDAGPVTVTVVNSYDGQDLVATVADGYSYALATASVTSLSSTTGNAGTQVTLTGTSFVGVSAVSFGTTSVAFSVANSTTIFVTVPVTPSGQHGLSAGVNVVNGTGNASTGGLSWTWDAKPLVTSMSKATGASGSTVTLTGTGFSGTTVVRFGGVDATAFTVTGDTSITVTVPPTPSAGSVVDNVSVIARTFTSPEPPTPAANDWNWAPIAAINAMSPNTSVAAGSTVTVTGRNFTAGMSVTVQTEPGVHYDVSSTVVVQSPTSFTFHAPPKPKGTAGNGLKPVTAVNTSGSASVVDAGGSNTFSY